MKKNVIIVAIIIMIIMSFFSGCINEKRENLPPIIRSFTVEPNEIEYGESAYLNWTVEVADFVTIDNEIGNVELEGIKIIQPLYTKNYTLTATLNRVNATESVKIIVNDIFPPTLIFTKDELNDTLKVAMIDPLNVLWSDLEINGSCDTTQLGTYVVEGNVISNCSEIITIKHLPTNALIGSWQFR